LPERVGAKQSTCSRGQPKSLVAEAAIISFLSPDDSDRRKAAIAKRLDRIARVPATARFSRCASDHFHKCCDLSALLRETFAK
jgi:hypothetical protein